MYIDGNVIGLGREANQQKANEEIKDIEEVTDHSLEDLALLGKLAGQQACGAADCCLDVRVQRFRDENTSGDTYGHYEWPGARIAVTTPKAVDQASCTPAAKAAVTTLSGIFSQASELKVTAERTADRTLLTAGDEAMAIVASADIEAQAIRSRALEAANTIRLRAYATLRAQLDEPK